MSDKPKPSSPVQKNKIDSNPIPYLVDGTANLFKSNTKSFLWTIALSLLPIAAVGGAVAWLLNSSATWGDVVDKAIENKVALGGLVVASLVVGFITFYMLQRVLLVGAKLQSTSLQELFDFTLKRSLPILGINIAVLAIFLLPVALVIWGMIAFSPWLALLLIPLVIAMIPLGFFLTPSTFVLVDDEAIGGVGGFFKKTWALWRHAFLALFIYVLLLSFLSGGIGSFSGSPTFPTDRKSDSSQETTNTVYYDAESSTAADESESNLVDDSTNTDAADFTSDDFNYDKFRQTAVPDWAKWITLPVAVLIAYVGFLSSAFQYVLYAGLARLYLVIKESLTPGSKR